MKDYLSELRRHQRAYHETMKEMIATSPMLCEADEENYSDSYKWLFLPVRDEHPETVSDMILSGVEDFPNDCLAGILLAILENRVPNGILLNGVSMDRVENSFHFCISGSTSLEDIRILCERYEQHRDFEV